MAKYSNTKAKINEKITTNGAQSVTGSILNDVLQTMVDSLGADYQFGGLVQPGSSFTAGEQPVVFLATTTGTYTNFGGLVVADGEVALLVWSGSAWSKQTPDISTRTELNQLGQWVENPFFIDATVDADGKFLEGTKTDGTKRFSGDVEVDGDLHVDGRINGEYLSDKVNKDPGKSLIDKNVADNTEYVENKEYIEVETDQDQRVLGGRRIDGTRVEFCDVVYPNGIPEQIRDLIPSKTSQLTNDSGYITGIPIDSAVREGSPNAPSGNAVFNAIRQAEIEGAQVTINSGLPFVLVVSSDAPAELKSVGQFVCDGVNDEEEIQEAIDSLPNGGLVHLSAGRFFISSAPITIQKTIIVEGEGGLIDLTWDTRLSNIKEGTIVKAVQNVDIFRVGASYSVRGVVIRNMCICGCGKLNENNTSYGIHIVGWIDVSHFYGLNVQDCYIGIGASVDADVCYFYNNSIQRNWLGMYFRTPFGDIHDNLFCENRGLETLNVDGTDYDVMVADLYTHNSGFLRLYNNTFLRSGTIIEKVQQEPIDYTWFKPMSSIVSRGCINEIYNNKFWQWIQGNCIAYLKSTFCSTWKIENNTFFAWGSKEAYMNGYTAERYRACIYIEYSAVKGLIQNNYFLGDDPVNSVPERYYRTYAVYMKELGSGEYNYGYSIMVFRNLFLNFQSPQTNCCKIAGTQSVVANNDKYSFV